MGVRMGWIPLSAEVRNEGQRDLLSADVDLVSADLSLKTAIQSLDRAGESERADYLRLARCHIKTARGEG